MQLLLPLFVFITILLTIESDRIIDRGFISFLSLFLVIPWFIYAQFLDLCTSVRILFNIKKYLIKVIEIMKGLGIMLTDRLKGTSKNV